MFPTLASLTFRQPIRNGKQVFREHREFPDRMFGRAGRRSYLMPLACDVYPRRVFVDSVH
ncbi:MAG: hypothetical protein AB7P14_19390 [Blastocatellales bacterium]